MALRNLQKWHGAGNDFLVEVIEHGTQPWWTPERAQSVLNRATGVGADGLLVATLGSEIAMRLYNADGSTAEMSGNGIRCLAAAVRHATNGKWNTLDVHTDAGVRTVTLEMDEFFGRGSVAMGTVSFSKTIEGTLGVANVGNPHAVVLDDETWSTAEREALAGGLAHQLGGANVEFVTRIDDSNLRIRVIERGVGWTLACGTGSVATAAVCAREGLSSSEVTVHNPGGPLTVKLDGALATLSGPVQFVANVEWLEA